MNKLLEALHTNLEQTYRKAVDADNSLNALQQDGKGKFSTIFGDDSPFTTRSKRFIGYVQELAEDIQALKALDEDALKAQLPTVVKKLELLLATLSQFKQTV
ncbi:hypothetical protein [Agaribacter marinus]|uniref:Prephenate dehydrogenase n=1 Tax=Agaribacter marinus TaxID=1431249 RepID=A0AA37T5M2_9ALTE|nr:hypothetical protein [Agaribacter marinus]GLR72638.1 hypothetical protein GCM10007852_35460 [Agaribacter marinus]